MNAKKCDRCGEIYGEMNKKGFDEYMQLVSIDALRDNKISRTYDLCPKCNDELQEWLMKGMKTNGYRINV